MDYICFICQLATQSLSVFCFTLPFPLLKKCVDRSKDLDDTAPIQSVNGGQWRSLEVKSEQSKACLNDKRGFVRWDGWMGLDGYQRYSKSTFVANNPHNLFFFTTIKINYAQPSNYSCFTWFVDNQIENQNMLIKKNYHCMMKIMDCIEKQGEIVRSRRH